MAIRDKRQPRRVWLRIAGGLPILLGAGLLFFATPGAPVGASAAAPAATCHPQLQNCASPTPSGFATPSCSPEQQTFGFCVSPEPSIVVISPVPLDSPSPATTPSYLIGDASPSPDTSGITGGTPVPLGGGFNALPSPGTGLPIAISNTGGGGGPPLPLLLVMFVLLAGGAGSVIYYFSPKGERFPEKAPEAPGVMFTPYGPETPALNLLDPDLGKPQRTRRPRSPG